MIVDGRRLRRKDKDYLSWFVRVEDPADVVMLDRLVKDLRNPPNRLVLHELLTNYHPLKPEAIL